MPRRTTAHDEFPYLEEDTRFSFPSVDTANEDGIVGMGGNLSPGMLLSAYSQGIFPWYSSGEPILWWSPDPRFVLVPEELHIPKSLKRLLRKKPFDISFDRQFERVMVACGETPRPDQLGTWITEEMLRGYVELHRLGYAHSVEVLKHGELVGGLYGVSLGSCFFGESMFSHESDASKIGFAVFMNTVVEYGISLVDSQVYTEHLARFGAKDVPREEYLCSLKQCLKAETVMGNWGHVMKPRYPT